MTEILFSRTSKIPPQPAVARHGPLTVRYTCHMAAIHWAVMTLGQSQMTANSVVGKYNVRHCPGCNGDGVHGSLDPVAYGRDFCASAQAIPDRDSLHRMVAPGDVLVTGHPSDPSHSMVVRQNRSASHVTIRGYNNIGTLGTGRFLEYDDVSHNITQDKYWKDPRAGRFGLPGVALFVVSGRNFLRAAGLLLQ